MGPRRAWEGRGSARLRRAGNRSTIRLLPPRSSLLSDRTQEVAGLSPARFTSPRAPIASFRAPVDLLASFQEQPPRYQVRWEDGHTNIFTSSGGSARIERKKRAAEEKTWKRPNAKPKA
jgi:hypothetical protein